LTNLTTFHPYLLLYTKRRRVYKEYIYIVNIRKILVRLVRNVSE